MSVQEKTTKTNTMSSLGFSRIVMIALLKREEVQVQVGKKKFKIKGIGVKPGESIRGGSDVWDLQIEEYE